MKWALNWREGRMDKIGVLEEWKDVPFDTVLRTFLLRKLLSFRLSSEAYRNQAK